MTDSTCSRCGTCCRKGGPALHEQDREFLMSVSLTDLVCLRKGEPAFDPRTGGVRPLDSELIKIRGKSGSWECLYFQEADHGCGIYAQRPVECRALSCWQTDAVLAVMASPVLSRCDFVRKDTGLWGSIEEHERHFPVSTAVALAGGHLTPVRGLSADLDEMIRGEMHFRKAVAAYVQASDEQLWAYFGRPLWVVLRPLGEVFATYALG